MTQEEAILTLNKLREKIDSNFPRKVRPKANLISRITEDGSFQQLYLEWLSKWIWRKLDASEEPCSNLEARDDDVLRVMGEILNE